MANKVVIHIFHADDSSLGTGAHVSERIRQVKDERGVALEVYIFGPAEKALADAARSEFRESSDKIGSEPIREVLESDESDVIHCWALDSRWSARCGSPNTAKLRTAVAFVTRAI